MGSISLRDARLLAVFCGQLLHLAFNKFEDDYLPQLLRLAAFFPLIPAYAFFLCTKSVLQALLTGYGVCYVALFSSIILYRISPFHPLSKYPGPVLAKCSKLWGLYQTTTGKMHVVFDDIHRKYGPIVRTGPNEISICDIDVVDSALGSNGMPKGPMWKGRVNPETGEASLVSERDVRRHMERRKPWNKGLSSSSVREYEPSLRNRVIQLVNSMLEKSTGKHYIDISTWITMFAYDFMGDMAFGGLGFELMRDGDVNGLWALMEHGIRVQAHTQHIPWATSLFLKYSSMGAAAKKLRAFVGTAAKQRAARGISSLGPDLSSWLLDELNPSTNAVQFKTYVREAQLIIVAGSDTSSLVISSLFHYILSNKEYFERLRNEIDEAFPAKDELPYDNANKLSEMLFLNALINETLRMTPPVPVDLQRGPERGSGGKFLGSVFIPEGTGVNIAPYVYSRDARYFSPYPEQFLPDRWLTDPSGVYQTTQEAFFPFSLGPMNCPGKGLALLEVRMVVATLVHQFDMDLKPGYDTKDWDKKLCSYFVFGRRNIPVRITARAR